MHVNYEKCNNIIYPNLICTFSWHSTNIKVGRLREKYGFSESGCIRYPIPYADDNAYWVYWK